MTEMALQDVNVLLWRELRKHRFTREEATKLWREAQRIDANYQSLTDRFKKYLPCWPPIPPVVLHLE